MTDPQAFAKDNLGRHEHFALATVNEDGTPWVVCVGLAYDDDYNFIWLSKKDAVHSQNITRDPHVSVCVFSKTDEVGDFGFYAVGQAHEVTDESELKRLLDIRFAQKGKPMPQLQDFLGDSEQRIYFARLSQSWVNSDEHVKQLVNLS